MESSGENLVFLISQPRAGSTMLQKILGAHPDIHTVSEPWIALHPLFALRDEGGAADYDAVLARTALREFLRHLPEGEEAYWAGLRQMLGHLYGRALEGSGKKLFLDKTPRYYFVVPELQRVFPRARFLFLIRNPLAVLSSILETWVKSEDMARLLPYRHDLLLAPRLLMQGIRRLGPSAIAVRYEKLTSAPEGVVCSLCQHLGIEFHPAMIDYGSASDVERWPFGDQDTVYRVTRPVCEPVDRWRQVFKRSPVWESWAHSYLAALGPDLIRDLGYDYGELNAELQSPASPNWVAQISGVSVELGGKPNTLVSLEQAAAIIKEQKERADTMEQAASQRLAALIADDASRRQIEVEADRRAQALRELTAALETAEHQIRLLQESRVAPSLELTHPRKRSLFQLLRDALKS